MHTATLNKFDLTHVELIGENMLMYLSHMEVENTLPYMEKHGIPLEIDPKKWYPAKNIFDFLWDIAAGPNSIYSLVSIGIESIRRLPLPPEVENLPLNDAFNNLIAAYYGTIMRGGDAGYIKSEQIAPNHIKVTCVTPLPDDGWYGTLYGMAQRFLPKGANFLVKYDEDTVRMDHGGDATILHVTWE